MTKGPSEKCRCGDENSSFRAKIAKDDKGVSGTDTSRRSESFAAERLNLQSQGCFSEGPKEIEIKILGIEKTAFEKAVKKAGGKKSGGGLMIIRHFDYPDKRLRKAGKMIRVRSIGDKIIEFAYKGPREYVGKCKVRPEIQTLVSDANIVSKILSAIGLEECMYCEKKRISYELNGTHIDIDEYPGNIVYAEIEGKTEKAVYATLDMLDIKDYEVSCETAGALFEQRWPNVELNGLRF
ncbi:hypothetical protein COW94_04325 [Candidatus Peregrinibacteria bacterium CG22_combo_CG10-13_8_21_14_all_44_10]|nr:MAG: hypothetical protein AUK45_04690 [Candidatus Peregrinibacteria bacterium CG2_30_44_17]PIP65957.1 MAG: hypothetical protein COW94_04325 [Candidatus Peregrinibacteria bacterium CG22_combo_CG10-13_8_21_14_all_44_10]PIS04025.1 MAG: hypothetical protein COT83_02850 [Candidatus Peregrinibacteria bacterium CG10_big_fil_rev_8_21_14_0_10_44_7]PJB88640.1 MAG: hypothetical protein CO082_03715 [Candidatus Peregrinibacteria bacterium CG_4_9_14_0_8_um_filter_44_15]